MLRSVTSLIRKTIIITSSNNKVLGVAPVATCGYQWLPVITGKGITGIYR